MKILVVFTGGTIGSSEGKKWISLDQETNYTLIENYKKQNPSDIVFEVSHPYSILSENLSNVELTCLCDIVRESVKKDYDGIIVTHGTDTIQYMASALAYTVKAQKPIVLVSANFPLENPLSNGNENFKSAVDFIKNKTANGVFVAYKNKNSEYVEVHNATSVTSHAEARDDLFGLQEKPFARVNQGKVEKLGKEVLQNALDKKVEFCEFPKILVINSCPGDDFSYQIENYNAVLIKPFHSGTLDTENKALHEFCKRANQKDVPVFLTNVNGGTAYESSKTYKQLSLMVLPYCSIPAIYMKIWIAVSLGKEVKQFVLNEMAGEFVK